jgi:hypothetical protein
MVKYKTIILRFSKMGEKTGWTYIDIPADVAQKIKPGIKVSYRVKGQLDDYKIKGVALLPMGEGAFIMPLNAEMRKHIGKKHGAMLNVQLEEDKAAFKFNADFIACLEDDPVAKKFFDTLPGSHQKYFSKWIDSAKTETTRAKRIAQSLNAFVRKMNYPQMMRSLKKEK